MSSVHHSLKLLGMSKPNIMWSLSRIGERNFVSPLGSHDQDGLHVHIG